MHHAASSDDADVAEALIHGGADIEKPDGSIGTPLDNAVGYGCWHVARLLAARSARVAKAWLLPGMRCCRARKRLFEGFTQSLDLWCREYSSRRLLRSSTIS